MGEARQTERKRREYIGEPLKAEAFLQQQEEEEVGDPEHKVKSQEGAGERGREGTQSLWQGSWWGEGGQSSRAESQQGHGPQTTASRTCTRPTRRRAQTSLPLTAPRASPAHSWCQWETPGMPLRPLTNQRDCELTNGSCLKPLGLQQFFYTAFISSSNLRSLFEN